MGCIGRTEGVGNEWRAGPQPRESKVAYQDTARKIEVEIIRLMGSEKIVPKSYRFTIALPTVRHARRLMEEVRHGVDFYPTDEHRLWERKRHWIEAVGCCDDIVDGKETP